MNIMKSSNYIKHHLIGLSLHEFAQVIRLLFLSAKQMKNIELDIKRTDV